MNNDDLTRPLPPEDTVPRRGMTRESLKGYSDAIDTEVSFTAPGEVTEDIDGVPSGVGPETVVPAALFTSITIARADVDRLGLTDHELETDYPNVNVMDPEERN